MLSRVLNEHCKIFGIRSDEGRESVAVSLLALYQAGVTSERELRRRIDLEDAPDSKKKPSLRGDRPSKKDHEPDAR